MGRTWHAAHGVQGAGTHAHRCAGEGTVGRRSARLVHLCDLVDEVLRLVVSESCKGAGSAGARSVTDVTARTRVVLSYVGEVVTSCVVCPSDWRRRSAPALLSRRQTHLMPSRG